MRNAFFEKRRCGVLLPLFSLPSYWGIGDFGVGARTFLDLLHSLQVTYWHILPLGPVDHGRGNSPYSSSSAFALNPLYVSPERMIEAELATREDVLGMPFPSGNQIDYANVQHWKKDFLYRTWERNRKNTSLLKKIEVFSREQQFWLEEYALFSVLKNKNAGHPWNEWQEGRAFSQKERFLLKYEEEVLFEKYVQHILFSQWRDLHDYASKRGIFLLGDVPFYVDYDSADVWAHQELFCLDSQGNPRLVGGVPPDYYSEKGQRWGNPVYDWEKMREYQYTWWVQRVQHLFGLCDALRLDHFRGFSAYWEIEASQEDAVRGTWKPSPGKELFSRLREICGELAFFAEDLGVITEDVLALRDMFGFPGMKVLQFAFENYASNPYASHNYDAYSVVFTGTHDNNTTRGWFARDNSSASQREIQKIYGDSLGKGNVHRLLVEEVLDSVACTAVIPFQDILGLGCGARINIPSKASGNWTWNLQLSQLSLDSELRKWFLERLRLSGRCREGA